LGERPARRGACGAIGGGFFRPRFFGAGFCGGPRGFRAIVAQSSRNAKKETPMRRALLALCLAALPATGFAQAAWPSIRADLYAARSVEPGAGLVTLSAPDRAADDRAVPMRIEARLPFGAVITRMTLVIDENPMPVSAVVDFIEPTRAAAFDFTMRLNGPSPVRAIIEADDGRLYMAETMVKTSGLGACAAPPVTNATAALATLGQMALSADAAGAPDPDRVRLSISHPSYSGLQMDQITLLYRPARFIETLEVWADETPLFTVTGSISLSENPQIAFDRPHAAQALRVRLTDTDGAVFERRFGLGAS